MTTYTDQGTSTVQLSSAPKELSDWFESYSKTISINYHPNLIEILLHLEMIRYNTTFAFSPRKDVNINNKQKQKQNESLIQCVDYLLNLLKNVDNNFLDDKYRTFSKSDKSFKDTFLSIQGAEVLLKYCGWTLIETDSQDNGGVYVYDEDNDRKYLNTVITLLTMYSGYLKGNMPNNNHTDNVKKKEANEIKWNDKDYNINNNFNNLNLHNSNSNNNNNHNKNNKNNGNHLSIFEDDDGNDNDGDEEKDLFVPRMDSYITPQKSTDTVVDVANINDLIENDIDTETQSIDIPLHLNINEFLLQQRAIVYGAAKNVNVSVYQHQWPSDIPGYALIEEHKKNNVNIFTYKWDEFPSHNYRFLAMECELNKFARINVSITLGNCQYHDIKSGSIMGDVQIFQLNDGSRKIQVLTELGPFEKKLIFTVKYQSRTQLLYSWRYSGLQTTLNDITEYIRNSNNMLSQAAEKYLKLYQKYNLQKLADKVSALHDILQNKLNVNCFVDLEFPPLTDSLMTKNNTDFEDTKAFEGLIWKRAIDFAEYPHLFGPMISLSDVEQGKLGNCGFAASLTAISIYPQLIKDLFLFPVKQNNDNNNNSFNENTVSAIGLYELRLCHNGIWRQYTIDDLIPCNYSGNPAFTAHENKNLLWVSLIEKCAAKAYGGYDRLISFCKLNAFNDLTGCPVEQIDFDIFEDHTGNILWNLIMGWSNNKYTVMTLAATRERSQKPISDLGIKGNHAFTFLKAVEVENVRLIQIRNPWGKCQNGTRDRWQGDYSRYNKNGEWTQTLKEIVNPGLDQNDGTFWMKLQDFRQYFRSASLCHLLLLDPTYKICRINSKILYDYKQSNNTEDISYPKLILDLTGGQGTDKMDLEWIGVQQENLRSQFAIHHEYLDCCLLIGQLKYPNDPEKCNSNNVAYIQPLRITECRKSKSEFEKIFAELTRGQKYVLIPYSTGITFHKNYKTLKQHQTRNVNISLFIKNKNGYNIQNDNNIKLEFQRSLNISEIKPILTAFVETLGSKRQSGDLEYIQATFGTLTFSGIRHTKFNRIMRGTFSFDLCNTLPAIGFDQGFILKNNICKNEYEIKQEHKNNYKDISPPKEWKWIYTCEDLKAMETNLFVMGQYQRFKRQQWRFNPEIFFSSMSQNNNNQYQRYNHNNNNNGNDWFNWTQ